MTLSRQRVKIVQCALIGPCAHIRLNMVNYISENKDDINNVFILLNSLPVYTLCTKI